MLEDDLCVPRRHVTPHESLVVGTDPTRVVGQPLGTLGARDRRQITDGLSKIDEDLVGLRPERSTMTIEGDEDQLLAMLRDAVPEAVENPGLDPVAERLEGLIQAREDRSVIPAREVGDVLHKHRRRAKLLNDSDE